jgi:hypothetical protein
MTNPVSSNELFAGIQSASAPQTEPESEQSVDQVKELDVLKSRARLMGINFSNNIGVEALRAKINAKMEGEQEAQETQQQDAAETPAGAPAVAETGEPIAPKKKVQTLRQMLVDREMRLVRVRITNLDPSKKDLPGEIFTVANRFLGTVRKFIPYGEVTDNGYHVPYCIYKQLEARRFNSIKTKKGKGGTPIVETQWAREFALEILPQLTETELARLAAAQAAAGVVE